MISQSLLDISPLQYMDRVRQAVDDSDLFVGLFKAPIFAFFIAIIGCMHGLRVRGSAESVGQRDHARRCQGDLPRDRAGCVVLDPVREARHMNAKRQHSADPILSAHGIVNRFGKQEVHDRISLDVMAGEIIGIAGGSGSGKSVLLKTLIGLHRPNAGEVLTERQDDRDAIDPAEKASLIGVLFQQGALFSSLSVAQNIMVPHARAYTDLPPGTTRRRSRR